MCECRVALYTSAWIEIFECIHRTFSIVVALYTSAWIEIRMGQSLKHSHVVALYTSAWIEIPTGKALLGKAVGRTLHECVD